MCLVVFHDVLPPQQLSAHCSQLVQEGYVSQAHAVYAVLAGMPFLPLTAWADLKIFAVLAKAHPTNYADKTLLIEIPVSPYQGHVPLLKNKITFCVIIVNRIFALILSC